MNTLFKTINLIVLFTFAVGQLEADTLKVPSEYENLQLAYAASLNGDTVEIELPGTYLGTDGFSLPSVSHSLKIVAKFPNTIIDLKGKKFIDTSLAGGQINLSLKGLTIKNTNDYVIRNPSGFVQVDNCRFIDIANGTIVNWPIHVDDIHMIDCSIVNCGAGSPLGFVNAVHCEFLHSEILNYRSVHSSIRATGSMRIIDNDFVNATEIEYSNKDPIVNQHPRGFATCHIVNNRFYNTGFVGRKFLPGSKSKFYFWSNEFRKSKIRTLQLFVENSEIEILNNIFSQGTDLTYSLWLSQASQSSNDIKVVHNTFTNNSIRESFNGALLYIDGQGTADIRNNIFWNPDIGSKKELSLDSQVSSKVEYNNFFKEVAGKGNISADPNFVNENSGDYHLTANSPCRDAGVQLNYTTDIDYNSRDSSPDMGADEFAPHVYWTGSTAIGQDAVINFIAEPGSDLKALVGDFDWLGQMNTRYGILLLNYNTFKGPFEYGTMGSSGHMKDFYFLPGSFTVSVQGLFDSKLTDGVATLTAK